MLYKMFFSVLLSNTKCKARFIIPFTFYSFNNELAVYFYKHILFSNKSIQV